MNKKTIFRKLYEIQVEDLMNKKYLPYLYFFIVTLFLHYFGYELYGDDMSVYLSLKSSVWEEFKWFPEYLNAWSSRFIINPMIQIMMHFDYRVWLVIEMALFMLIFNLIINYGLKEKRVPFLYIAASVMCTLTYLDLDEVGWVVVSMTYIWVTAAAMVACLSISKSFNKEKIAWYNVILYLVLTVYATNKEEMSVMLVVIFTTALIVALKQKKQYVLIALQLGISIWAFFGHLLSPHNQSRYERKLVVTAVDNTFFDKVVIGISSTLRHVVFERNYSFLCLAIILVLVIWFSCKSIVPKLVSLIPLILWFMTWVPGKIDYMFGTNVTGGPRVIAVIILGVIAVLSIFVCLYYLYGFSDKMLVLVTMLTAGFAGRCVVGFANSGWQRYERTYTFLYFIFIIVSIIMACDVWDKLSYKKKRVLFGVIVVLGQIGVIKNILDTGII